MEQSWLVACLLFLHVLTASLTQATASQPNAQPISTRSGRNSHKKRPTAMSFVEEQQVRLVARLRLVDPSHCRLRGVFDVEVWGYRNRTFDSKPRPLKATCHSLHCAGLLRETQGAPTYLCARLFPVVNDWVKAHYKCLYVRLQTQLCTPSGSDVVIAGTR
ncbi:hypothetical protein SNOG_14019 [Parastagonospora nodorum SN15]|uniref:Cyanovirin-N domain-containing protein n=1 Tax=Phaeosphaeria nodorum (strain SN15 / ATCC MYA-4574 / FGSC 10173) TaxID=321614 RepID=Q0U2L4_PHANO|nr:hypothetical protein SNOG_14019 [Parastagonospora nodorum SN15]EAT78644.1 hypothetical protein SNOG_14019 [Parastagonospora nodorum SN15]